MSVRRAIRRIAALFQGRRLDVELDHEIRAHLELAERDARALGLDAAEAARLARLQFGSIQSIKDAQRDVRRPQVIDAVWRDVRYAGRRLRSTPGFATAAILTIGLGVGLTSLALAATRGLLHGPISVPDADRAVWLTPIGPEASASRGRVSSISATTIADRTDLFASVAVIGARSRILAIGAQRAEWKGLSVTIGLADVLGVTPAAGRTFTVTDLARRSEPPAMMIGFTRWQRDFGGDPSIVGRVLRFEDNKPHTVVGVLPRGLAFPEGRAPGPGTGTEFTLGEQDFWILVQDSASALPGGVVIARLRDAVTASQASAGLAALRFAADHTAPTISVVTVRDHALGAMRSGLPLLSAFAVFVLLIACANLATMMLARGTQAQEETGLRLALGARPIDLWQLGIAEAAWIAAPGALLGIAFVHGGRALFARTSYFPNVDRVALDGTVFIAAFAISAAAMAVATITRAAAESWARRRRTIRIGERDSSVGVGVRRSLNTIICAQVSITLVLLIGAGLVVRSLGNLLAVDTGYDRHQVVVADVLLFEPPAQFVPYFVNLHARLRTLAGVEAVGLVQSTPLTGKWTFRDRIGIEGGPSLDAPGTFVAFEYFEAMSIPILQGRTFTHAEAIAGRSRSIIINDLAAAHLFPGAPAVGRSLLLLGRRHEIVGVVGATRDVGLHAPAEPQWYQPAFVGGSQVVVRTSHPAPAFVETLRRELLASDPRLIVKEVEPLATIVDRSVADRRAAAELLGAAAGIAALLAVAGLYGVVNFHTIQRRREFSIRVALGATPRSLVTLVMRHALALSIAGICLGTVVSVPLSQVLRSLLFGLQPGDATTVAGVATALLATAAVTSAIPAWRAGRADPVEALK